MASPVQPGKFRKTWGKPSPPPPSPRQKPGIGRIPPMGGRTIAGRIIKPVGTAIAILCLIGSASAQTTIGAPQGGEAACPFPGCKGTSSVLDISQWNPPPPTSGDATPQIQAAINSGAPIIYFPEGTYQVCNLKPAATNQIWRGAGRGRTILTALNSCNNLTVTSSGGIVGPIPSLIIEGMTFQGAGQSQIIAQCRDIERLTIRDNAFDTGGIGCPTSAAGPAGINITGCRNFSIVGNEFYSSCPGAGGRGIIATGIHGGRIVGNTSAWQRTFTEVQTTANQPAEFLDFSNNRQTGAFWAMPTRY